MVSHLFYADDLVLVSHTARGLQWMLNKLSEYGKNKELTVNVHKSKVVVFNSHSRAASPEPSFTFEDHALEVVDEFKYLGVLFDKGLSFDGADRHWAGALMGAIRRLLVLAKDHGITNRLDLMLRLFQSYAVSSGLYGSHIWATQFLTLGHAWDSQVQRRHLCFLRRLVEVRNSTCRWPLLYELGQVPIFFYW